MSKVSLFIPFVCGAAVPVGTGVAVAPPPKLNDDAGWDGAPNAGGAVV